MTTVVHLLAYFRSCLILRRLGYASSWMDGRGSSVERIAYDRFWKRGEKQKKESTKGENGTRRKRKCYIPRGGTVRLRSCSGWIAAHIS